MALINTQLAILKTELDTDPQTLGYAGTSHPSAAALLNTVGLSEETIANIAVPTESVLDAVVSNELGNIPINELLFFLQRVNKSNGSIDISEGSAFLTQISQTFSVADAPNSRVALILLKARDASRAEVLFGAGVVVTMFDVAEARQL